MAKYKKADNCGPVPYPDGSGRFLGEGEVSDLDGWEPYVALGYVVQVDDSVAATPDKEETPEELAKAVKPVVKESAPKEKKEKAPEPAPKTVTEMAKDAAAKSDVVENAGESVVGAATKAAKGKKKKKGTKSSDVSGD